MKPIKYQTDCEHKGSDLGAEAPAMGFYCKHLFVPHAKQQKISQTPDATQK